MTKWASDIVGYDVFPRGPADCGMPVEVAFQEKDDYMEVSFDGAEGTEERVLALMSLVMVWSP